MVCLGNICRSPLAEGILRKKAEDAGVKVFIDSAGTSGFHDGESPDKRSMANALTHGVDLSSLESRKFIVEDFDAFDYIYVMDESNRENVLKLARNDKDVAKVDMLLNKSFPGQDIPVPDPYFGGEEGFENVFQLVNKACEKITEELK